MSAETGPRSFAFIALLRDETEARALCGLLEGLARAEAASSSVFLVPEVRGLDFFADPRRQSALDRWWGRCVPRDAIPVYLLRHEDGLAAWLHGVDGVVFVATDEEPETAYPDGVAVRSGPAGAPLALAEAVVTWYGSTPGSTSAATDVFDVRDARMIARIRAHPDEDARPDASPSGPQPADTAVEARSAAATPHRARPELPPLFALEGIGGGAPAVIADVRADPLDRLAAESAARERESPIWPAEPDGSVARQRGRGGPLAALQRRCRRPGAGGQGRGGSPGDAELAAALLARSGRVVVVGSRKGGVGKTSHAAGMAIAAGMVLDSVGHVAAIVDANIANPDAWGQLHLPRRAATVRDVVAALARGDDPPAPVHAVTPALACYPEIREGAEYGRTDIRRLAAHLRARHALVIVDMSNRLPDPTGGPEAAAAAYWLEEADALVLPTAMSRQDFNGVLDYLDVRDLPPTVVTCIVAGARRNRRHPVTREYLDVIASRADRLVEVPDEADSVRLAGMDGVPVQEVSVKMRAAYRAMLDAVARLPARARQ